MIKIFQTKRIKQFLPAIVLFFRNKILLRSVTVLFSDTSLTRKISDWKKIAVIYKVDLSIISREF